MTVGTVKWFNRAKGYGFIEPEGGDKDAFVHISAVQKAGMDTLAEGQKVEYELVKGANGKFSAEDLKDLSGGGAAEATPAPDPAPDPAAAEGGDEESGGEEESGGGEDEPEAE